MQKKTDRRVRKTKSQLRKGLAHLMKEKSIGEITVKDNQPQGTVFSFTLPAGEVQLHE